MSRTPDRAAPAMATAATAGDVAKLVQMFEEQQRAMGQLQMQMSAAQNPSRDEEDWWGAKPDAPRPPQPTMPAMDDDAIAIANAQKLLERHGLMKPPPKMPSSKARGAAPLWNHLESFDLSTPSKVPADGDAGKVRYVVLDEGGEPGEPGMRASATVCAIRNLERARADAPSQGRKRWGDLVRRLQTKVPAHGSLKMQFTQYFAEKTNVRRHKVACYQLTAWLEVVDALETNDQEKMLHAVSGAIRFLDQYAFEDGKFTTAHRVSLLETPIVPYERDAKKLTSPPDTVFAPLVSEELVGLATGAGKALAQVTKDLKDQE
jgi:hypothetical protein